MMLALNILLFVLAIALLVAVIRKERKNEK